MEAKIEKTMDYRIIGGNDELLNIMIAENYRGYIEHNPFTKTKDNPDTILEITAKLVEYSPNKIEEKKNRMILKKFIQMKMEKRLQTK